MHGGFEPTLWQPLNERFESFFGTTNSLTNINTVCSGTVVDSFHQYLQARQLSSIMTREPPQVQAIISSRNISDEGAKKLLSKFLMQQKSFFDDDDKPGVDGEDVMNSDDIIVDMGEEDGQGTLEEIHARLEGISRSLSGIKNPTSPASVVERTPAALVTSSGDDKSDAEEEPLKFKSEIIDEDTRHSVPQTPATIEKMDKKSAKKAEKESKKLAKKAEKEAKKSAKKAEKEAKKSAKKAAKEAKKSAKKVKKEKKKRKNSEDGSSAVKRTKIEA